MGAGEMTKTAPTYLDRHFDLYFAVLKLAKLGYGIDDCIVKLSLPRDAETRAWVKRIVLGKGNDK
jgi:hypothetical protein